VCQGAPQEPRRPCRLRVKSRIGPPGDQRPGPRQAARPRRGANNEPSAVRPSEGNEVRPEGRQGVAALRSTGGAGELAPEDPVCEATTPTTASRGTRWLWRASRRRSGELGGSGSLAARTRRRCRGSASLDSSSAIRSRGPASCTRHFVPRRVLDPRSRMP
jgi:hypothetical protein